MIKNAKIKKGFNAVVLALLLFWSALILSGCNTVQGMGEDVEAGGEGIQEMAD